MTTTPDPKAVREIAEEAILEAVRTASIVDVLPGHPALDGGDYDEWYDVIAAQLPSAVVTVTWPDEPQQGRPGADLAHAAEDVRTHLALRARAVNDEVIDNPDVLAVVRTGRESHALMESVVRTLLAERDALAACADGRLWARLRKEIERRSYAVTHAKVVEEKCDRALAELEQLHARYETSEAAPIGQPKDDGDVRAVASDEPRPGHGPGVPGAMHLKAFGQSIADAFGHCPYHVGSSATSKTWRDVDVRLILDDDRFHALFPGFKNSNHIDAWWSLLCAALSELGRARTGLPIDFQIQSMTEANEKYDGIRNPLFLIHARDEHQPAFAALDARDAKAEPGGGS